MQLKVQYFVVLFLVLCHSSNSAPFLANTLIMYRTPGAGGQSYLQEIYPNGTEVQRITLTGAYAALTLAPMHLDATGGAFSFIYSKSINAKTYSICSSIDATGTEVSTTKFETGINGVGHARTCYVSDQNVWIMLDITGVAFLNKGASVLTTTNILSGCCGGATGRDLQFFPEIRIYAGYGGVIKSGSPVETTGSMTTTDVYSDSNMKTFYIHKQKLYVIGFSSFQKFTLGADGTPNASPDYVFDGTIPDKTGAFVLTAVDSGSVTHIYLIAYVPFTYSLYRFTDDGTSISAPVLLIDHSNDAIYGITASPSACNDGIKNVDETDIDCGGIRCKTCADDKTCSHDADCTSNFCNPDTRKCATPSCMDTFKNQDETDVDCGGDTCGGCQDGWDCVSDGDCAAGFCTSGKVCATPTCNDGVKNQDESDVDCGGAFCEGCNVGASCTANSDCFTYTCEGSVCIATCSDSVQDQDETDVDCGGNNCTTCADSKSCLVNGDCTSGYCNPNNKCSTPSCDDDWMNQDETDMNCGGEFCLPCSDTKKCLLDRDCQGAFCIPVNKTCASPSCLDSYQNQDESDVDCGGATCSGCEVGQSCVDSSDCASNTCVEGVCANAPVSPPVAVPVSTPQTSSPSNQEPVAATPGNSKPVSSADTVGLSIALLSALVMLI